MHCRQGRQSLGIGRFRKWKGRGGEDTVAREMRTESRKDRGGPTGSMRRGSRWCRGPAVFHWYPAGRRTGSSGCQGRRRADTRSGQETRRQNISCSSGPGGICRSAGNCVRNSVLLGLYRVLAGMHSERRGTHSTDFGTRCIRVGAHCTTDVRVGTLPFACLGSAGLT